MANDPEKDRTTVKVTRAKKTDAPEAAPEATEPDEMIVSAEAGSVEHIKTLNLYEKLLLIEEAAGVVKKTGENKDQGWKYMEHAEIVAVLRPLLIQFRVKYLYSEVSNTITPQDGWNKEAGQVTPRGAKSQKRAMHILLNIDEPEDRFTAHTETEANSTSDKASNASSTYAQKLFYLRTFNLSDVDPDAETIEAAPVKPTAKISKSRETDIYTMLKRLGLNVEDYEVSLSRKYAPEGTEIKVSDLTNAQAQDEIDNMVAYITRQTVSKPKAIEAA